MTTDNIPDLKPHILRGATEYGLSLNDTQLESLQHYFGLLLAESRNQNLVSKNDLSRFAEYHILDSLKITSCHDFTTSTRMLDFGSGAGVPGIPLAIAFPSLETLLVDSRTMRCRFLERVCAEIPVPNARVACSRIESIPDSDTTLYDVVITRATVSLAKYYEVGKRFLAPGGVMIAVKGETVEKELKALESVVDKSVFNITCTYPTPVENVRTGTVIIIGNKKLSTNTPES